MRVLISGASIAGPVLAYWLSRVGFEVTVVERAPALRKTGGHAIDLFRPAMEISERMGVLPRIEARATGTTVLAVNRPWSSRPARINYLKLEKMMSDRHVEIMRDDLSEIYYDAGRDDVEYVFGDQIAAISDDGDVTFRNGAPRRFDIVVGADGLHSGVRQIVFGDSFGERFLGSYISVVSVPKAVVDKIGPPFVSVMIPANTYTGQDKDVPTAAVVNYLVTSSAVSDDLAYQMTKLIFESLPELANSHVAGKEIKLETAAMGSPVPLHPGAIRYYKEKGVIK